MKAVILAAGRGSRLKGFTEDKPKCLNMIDKSTILECQLTALNKAGIKEIVIVTGYKSEMLADFGCRTVLNNIWDKTNMVVSLLCASEEFNQPVIVSYSDIVYGAGVAAELIRQDKDAVVVYDRAWEFLWRRRFNNPLQDAESFIIDEESRIRDIGRKVDSIDQIQGQYIGLMKFSPQAFQWMKDFTNQQPDSILNKMDMTTLLRLLIEQGKPIYGMAINAGWCEIDTIADLSLANELYRQGELVLN